MERDTGPRLSSPPVVPADLPMSGVDAFFVQDTPRECWRPPLAAKVAARKAFQVVVRKRLRKQGKNANRYRWRDDGLAVDWVRRTPTDESDDDEIQVIEAPPAAPIPTFVLEDSPEPGPLPPPSSSSNGGTRRWFPHSPPVAKRQRVTEPPAWQASGSHRPPAEPTQSISSSPMVSAAALPEVWAGSSVPPEALVRSSVPPEPARASSTAPQETLLEIQARMQALEDEMGARMRELQEQMKAAMQEQHMG
ncbi:hypothetical protein CspeluHIS016_0604090 [Cutaneotrichosporon spelunceum]|uniref:Uncharacterized protein n=1 Tax=Cutaneotrichosporon spelunceum TaxID=1672016 RepID=A0AAD3TY00_9TREE|nr:hypothetical protein CspeluHIS016_0604090 [Cutaneotrichosporon spelunceum]